MAIVRQIDLKHHIDEKGDIVKTTNGVVIPLDEPTILFRGRDYLAVPLLIKYREMCVADGCNDFQLEQVNALIAKFAKFATDNPGTMSSRASRGVCDGGGATVRAVWRHLRDATKCCTPLLLVGVPPAQQGVFR